MVALKVRTGGSEIPGIIINGYCNNTISRLDIDVLARLCYALNCEINDLLEYIPPDQKDAD